MGWRMKHREDMEQCALMQWARITRHNGGMIADWLIAIPNGGKRNASEAARMKKQGVKAGVSDLFLALPSKQFHGLWIEMKAPKTNASPAGKPTQVQLDWLDRMAAAGYAAQLCFGWQAAKDAITEYLQ